MLGMREINDDVLLSIDINPQEEDAKKSLDFDYFKISLLFFTAVSYNPHVCITNLDVCDFVIAYLYF